MPRADPSARSLQTSRTRSLRRREECVQYPGRLAAVLGLMASSLQPCPHGRRRRPGGVVDGAGVARPARLDSAEGIGENDVGGPRPSVQVQFVVPGVVQRLRSFSRLDAEGVGD